MWRLFAMGFLTLSATTMMNPAIPQDADRTEPPQREGTPPPKADEQQKDAKANDRRPDDNERRRWDWRRQPPQISAEFRGHVIAVIQDLQNQPMSEEQRAKLEEMKPEEFLRVFQENAGTILAFARLRERTPELYELKVRDYQLMREVRGLATEVRRLQAAGETNAATTLAAKMRGLIEEQFEIDLKARAIEVRLLEERIEMMKRDLAERAEEKSALIDQRVQRVLEADSRNGGDDDSRRRGGPGDRDGGPDRESRDGQHEEKRDDRPGRPPGGPR